MGFRFSAYRQAQVLRLAGWVCNRSDGSVEAEFDGERSALEDFLAWCKKGPPSACVETVDATWRTGDPPYSCVEIR